MRTALALLTLLSVLVPGPGQAQEPIDFSQIRDLRLRGALSEARALAERALAAQPGAEREVALRLELARIHDRRGLHRNTRPVPEALREIAAAGTLAESVGGASRAEVALALADYHYRAEMDNREFPEAIRHAERAIVLFRELDDRHGEAEAVHRRGLVHLQRGELEDAHRLFDRSLVLDSAGGGRTFFRGEYERHVGFVLLLEGDAAGAVPYFERSFSARREAGAIDAAMFAATTLASALVDLGRFEAARPPLLYAMLVAERLDSPVGKARTGLVLGRLYQGEGEPESARLAFEMTAAIAASVGDESLAARARAALE